jgi:two-component system chemotaxis sensor kinase CheA
MTGSDAELTALFRDEATERLDEMDAALLAVESGEAGAETVDELFRNAHTVKGSAAMLGFTDISSLAHAVEDVLAAVREAGVFPAGQVAPLLRATAALRANVGGAGEPVAGLIDELAAARAAAGTAAGEPPAGEESPAVESPAGEAAPAREEPAGGRSLRVPATKIDHLIDVVGEVMQDRSQLAHVLGGRARLDPATADALGAGDRMLSELKDTAIGMRTLPLAAITGPLPRAVRDLARAAGKEVDFTVSGAATELDRVILESLAEPLTHLLRNAVSHGIEEPAERQQAGKPPRGRIELRAAARGRVEQVSVADDGRGVAPEVMDQARREGSLADVVSRPGFSTAAGVSEVAGRGVGLDAVKAYVQSLGGSFDVSSEPGHGTEVTLLLPLALALLEVLLARRGTAVYGVPLAAVEEVVTVAETLSLEGRPSVAVHRQPLPAADLAALVGAPSPPLDSRPPGVVVSAAGRRVVVTCDALIGQEEVVVKPLGPLIAGATGYLGAAILGDGTVALLLEPGTLTRGAQRPETSSTAPATPAHPAKVLVVEDSFTVRELQRSILEAAGYPVATARDGQDALAVLHDDPSIALVITDLEMPGLDGIGLTRAIRADPQRRSLPVVVVTSHGSEEDRQRGSAAGADAYMVKQDFDQQALLATVERLAGR